MNNELRERLKKYMSSRGFPAQHESEIIAMVENALSPVLPEEVQEVTKRLANCCQCAAAGDALDLIEKLQARIEELEGRT